MIDDVRAIGEGVNQQICFKLSGLTHKQALVVLTEQNDDIVRVTYAKLLLVMAGLVKGHPKNVASHLYHILSDDVRFERIAPGTFRLRKTIRIPSMDPGDMLDDDDEPQAIRVGTGRDLHPVAMLLTFRR